jgi:hypothetical protein
VLHQIERGGHILADGSKKKDRARIMNLYLGAVAKVGKTSVRFWPDPEPAALAEVERIRGKVEQVTGETERGVGGEGQVSGKKNPLPIDDFYARLCREYSGREFIACETADRLQQSRGSVYDRLRALEKDGKIRAVSGAGTRHDPRRFVIVATASDAPPPPVGEGMPGQGASGVKSKEMIAAEIAQLEAQIREAARPALEWSQAVIAAEEREATLRAQLEGVTLALNNLKANPPEKTDTSALAERQRRLQALLDNYDLLVVS